MAGHRLIIPELPSGVTLNARSHWGRRHKRARDMRAQIIGHAADQGMTAVEPPVEVRLLYRLPTRQSRDLDNLVAAAKPWLDGLVDAGVLPADDVFTVRRLTADVEFGKPARTVITVIPMRTLRSNGACYNALSCATPTR